MPINSKQKGKRAEREFAHFLCEHLGIECRRGQQFQGTPESPDVVGLEGIHIECKHQEHLNLIEAMEQAKRECGGNIPLVAHRKNRTEWLITIRAEELWAFVNKIHSIVTDTSKPNGVSLVPEEHRNTLLQGNGAND